ncbi:MAG: His/Gly/Thr/Pro-type tRNA ligase C-terminal domain-containing protein, partial [Dehalococcoidales bacterium]|nr:His/Gly/Thr/Pro-type tRNA ligase C-terminal domain-containing protein [Dehalococcoidales bacterium]
YARKLETDLKADRIRAEVDDRSERVNMKIRQAQLEKVPYMLIIGDKEVTASTISLRLRSGQQLNDQSLESFKQTVKTAIDTRAKE